MCSSDLNPQVAFDILGGGSDSGGVGGYGSGSTETLPYGAKVPIGSPLNVAYNPRQFAANTNDLLRYGYGPEHSYYTYAAKGGPISTLAVLRKVSHG